MEIKYFYAKDGSQLGPFTKEELKDKFISKSTLVWTDGLENWVEASEIEDLRSILVSVPPPLPKSHQNKIKGSEQTAISNNPPRLKDVSNSNVQYGYYDPRYEKETEAIYAGIVMFIVPFILSYLLDSASIDMDQLIVNYAVFGVVYFIAVIILTIWASNIAKRQNRDPTVWGLFTFFFTPLALIIIGSSQKIYDPNEIEFSNQTSQSATSKTEFATSLAAKNLVEENYFQGEYFLDKQKRLQKLRSPSDLDFFHIDSLKYAGGFPEIDSHENLEKLKTTIVVYSKGIYIKVEKILKMYEISISYNEIERARADKNNGEILLFLRNNYILKLTFLGRLSENSEALLNYYQSNTGRAVEYQI